MSDKIRKTENEWRKKLTEEQFKVMREHRTEAPFSCALESPGEGMYNCAACDLPLFQTAVKFESRTGWPSFFAPIAEDHLEYIEDESHGMHRTEVRCARCESHLGHVFDDGPLPTKKRYCINSIAMKFSPAKNDK